MVTGRGKPVTLPIADVARFIAQPRAEITSKHTAQEKALGEDVSNLTKKAKYFEKQMDEANGQLRDIVSGEWRGTMCHGPTCWTWTTFINPVFADASRSSAASSVPSSSSNLKHDPPVRHNPHKLTSL